MFKDIVLRLTIAVALSFSTVGLLMGLHNLGVIN